MKSTLHVAFCGMASALSVVLLFLTNFFPTATIALPALAGVLLMPVVVEIGIRWGWTVFAVCTLLSFFLMADKEAFFMYVLFFGYYPVLKALIEKYLHTRVLSWVLKLLVLNVAMAADVLLVIFVLQIPLESFFDFGLYTPVILAVAANIIFVIYDFALSGLVAVYWQRLHPMIAKTFRKGNQ